jgi:SNF2 family DNA or RNA helicase
MMTDIWERQNDYAQRLAGLDRAFLILAPRSGKTKITIEAIGLRGAKRILVVTPAILRESWKREIVRWGSAYPADGRVWDVISYNALINRHYNARDYDVIVLDESVSVKNRQSKRYAVIKAMVRDYRGALWLLSGNPAPRYLDDLWTQLNLLMPRAFGSYWRFAFEHCEVERSPWGTKITGNRHGTDFLRDLDFVITGGWERPTDEVAVWTAMDEDARKIYRAIQRDEIEVLKDYDLASVNALQKLSRLLMLVNNPGALKPEFKNHKLAALADLLTFAPAPVLIFFFYRSTGQALKDLGFDVIFGETPAWARDVMISNFQQRGGTLALSIALGAYGLTLPARSVIFLERTFNADHYTQALYRAVLPNQDYMTQVWLMVTPGTVDEVVHRVISARDQLSYRLIREVIGEND